MQHPQKQCAKPCLLHLMQILVGPCMQCKAANRKQKYITDCRCMQLLITFLQNSAYCTDCIHSLVPACNKLQQTQTKIAIKLQMHAIYFQFLNYNKIHSN